MSPFLVVGALIVTVMALAFRALTRPGARRPRRGPGPGASGAVYELLNEDKRKAIEIIVEGRAGISRPGARRRRARSRRRRGASLEGAAETAVSRMASGAGTASVVAIDAGVEHLRIRLMNGGPEPVTDEVVPNHGDLRQVFGSAWTDGPCRHRCRVENRHHRQAGGDGTVGPRPRPYGGAGGGALGDRAPAHRDVWGFGSHARHGRSRRPPATCSWASTAKAGWRRIC